MGTMNTPYKSATVGWDPFLATFMQARGSNGMSRLHNSYGQNVIAYSNNFGDTKLIAGIEVAGMIHDLGKIAIPAGILSKPCKLSDNERNLIQTHSQEGYDILKDIEFRWPMTPDADSKQKEPHISEDPDQPADDIILPIAQIVLQHHERMDGSGYPAGLMRDDILEEARIIAVADVIEAMVNHRPYRPALSDDKVLEEIIQKKGILYDSEVVEACFQVYGEKGFPSEN